MRSTARAASPSRSRARPAPNRASMTSVEIGGADTGEGRRPRRSNRRPHGRRRPSGAPGFPEERGRRRAPAPADAVPRRNRRRRCCPDRRARGRVARARAICAAVSATACRRAASAYSRASPPQWSRASTRPSRRSSAAGASTRSAAKAGLSKAGASDGFLCNICFLFRRSWAGGPGLCMDDRVA